MIGALTFEKLRDSFDKIPPDPMVVYAKERGFDLDERDVLVLPIQFRYEVDWSPFGPPGYVQFSPLVPGPVLLKVPHA